MNRNIEFSRTQSVSAMRVNIDTAINLLSADRRDTSRYTQIFTVLDVVTHVLHLYFIHLLIWHVFKVYLCNYNTICIYNRFNRFINRLSIILDNINMI